jgi:hypothetical protein
LKMNAPFQSYTRREKWATRLPNPCHLDWSAKAKPSAQRRDLVFPRTATFHSSINGERSVCPRLFPGFSPRLFHTTMSKSGAKRILARFDEAYPLLVTGKDLPENLKDEIDKTVALVKFRDQLKQFLAQNGLIPARMVPGAGPVGKVHPPVC